MSVGFGLLYLYGCAELFKATIDVQTRNCVPFQMDNDGWWISPVVSFSFRRAMRRGYDQTDTDSFLRHDCVCPVFHYNSFQAESL